MLIKSKKIRIECLRRPLENPFEEAPKSNWRVERAVRGALRRLSAAEREVVERFHFGSETLAEVGACMKTPPFRVNSILKDAQRKLKILLGPFVQKQYGIPIETDSCRICRSEKRAEIEKLLNTKNKEETWKRILRKLSSEFRIQTNARSLARHLNRH